MESTEKFELLLRMPDGEGESAEGENRVPGEGRREFSSIVKALRIGWPPTEEDVAFVEGDSMAAIATICQRAR
jgi:hypothetical protein